jgi:hypothetical protein
MYSSTINCKHGGAHWFNVKMFVTFVTRFLMDHSIHVSKHVIVVVWWNAAAWTSVTVWRFALVSFHTKWCSCPCAVVKAYRTSKVQLHSCLTSALDGCEWSASHFDRFDPGDNIIVTCCVRGRVGLGVAVDVSESDKCLLPAGNRTFNFRVVQAVAGPQYRLSCSGS